MTACFSRRILNRFMEEQPEKVALRGPTVELDYNRMFLILTSFAVQLRKRGIGPKSVVILELEPGVWFLSVLLRLAINLLGSRWMIANQKSLAFEGATHLISTDPKSVTKHRNFILFEPNWIGLNRQQALAAAPGFPGLQADDIVAYSSTSATTGHRKLVRSPLGEFEQSIKRNPLTGDSFATLFSYGGERSFRRLTAALESGTLIIDSPDPRVDRLRPDILTASPVQLTSWLDKIEATGGSFQKMKHFYSMGSAVTRDTVARWLQYFENVSANYAGTEMGSVGTFSTSKPLEEDFADYEIADTVSLEIVDDSGRPVPAGEAGIIRVRTPRLDKGRDDQNLYAADGWFYPGDRGLIRANGRLVVLGREGDVLNIGGVKFNAEFISASVEKFNICPFAIAFEVKGEKATELALLVDPGSREDHAAMALELRKWFGNFNTVPKISKIHFSRQRPVNENGKVSRALALRMSGSLEVF